MTTLPALCMSLLLLLGGLPAPGEVAVYLPGEEGLELRLCHRPLEGETPQALVDILVEENVFPDDVQVLSFTDKPTAVLDLSREFGEALNRTGSEGEMMMVYALTNTVLTHYGLESLTLTCEGQVVETGHQVYDRPLTFCKLCVDWGG